MCCSISRGEISKGYPDDTGIIRRYHPGVKRDLVIAILSTHRADLRALGVQSLFLFGSVARDEARIDSDVDVLVELDHSPTLFELARIKLRLEGWLGASVDLGLRDAVREPLRDRVFREAIRAA